MGRSRAAEVTIRSAQMADAGRIAELSTQLGYPATEAQMSRRLSRILPDGDQAVLVAEDVDGQVVGWAHGRYRWEVVVEPLVQLEGLVVEASCRGQGLGRRLLEAVEAWARERGCAEIALRSNIIREQAHGFYGRLGYEMYKTSFNFRKRLLD